MFMKIHFPTCHKYLYPKIKFSYEHGGLHLSMGDELNLLVFNSNIYKDWKEGNFNTSK